MAGNYCATVVVTSNAYPVVPQVDFLHGAGASGSMVTTASILGINVTGTAVVFYSFDGATDAGKFTETGTARNGIIKDEIFQQYMWLRKNNGGDPNQTVDVEAHG